MLTALFILVLVAWVGWGIKGIITNQATGSRTWGDMPRRSTPPSPLKHRARPPVNRRAQDGAA